jgi:hypothetical protein
VFTSSEIASVALAPDGIPLAAVGFWGSNEVKIVSLSDLQVLETVVEASLPRSILIRKDPEDTSTESVNKFLMLVGNGDGSVTTRKLCLGDVSSSPVTIGSRNSLAMGRTPVHLAASTFEAESSQILCISDRVSVLYEEQERLSRSAFNLSVSA